MANRLVVIVEAVLADTIPAVDIAVVLVAVAHSPVEGLHILVAADIAAV